MLPLTLDVSAEFEFGKTVDCRLGREVVFIVKPSTLPSTLEIFSSVVRERWRCSCAEAIAREGQTQCEE